MKYFWNIFFIGFYMLMMVPSDAQVYALKQGNVTYYSNSYSPGAVQSNGRAGNVTVLADASSLNTNVNYPTAAPKVQPNIILGGIVNGDTIPFDQPVKLVSRFAILAGLNPVLLLDENPQPIPPDGNIILKNLNRGEHRVKAIIVDANGNVFAQSNEIHFTVQQASALNATQDQGNQGEQDMMIDATKLPKINEQ